MPQYGGFKELDYKNFSATLAFWNNLAKYGRGKLVEIGDRLVFITNKEIKEMEKAEKQENNDLFKIEVVVKHEELQKNKEDAMKVENFETSPKYIVAKNMLEEFENQFSDILKDHEMQVLEIKQRDEKDNFTEADLERLNHLKSENEKINIKSNKKKFDAFLDKNKDVSSLEQKVEEEEMKKLLDARIEEERQAQMQTQLLDKRIKEAELESLNNQTKQLKKELRAINKASKKVLVPSIIKEKLSTFSFKNINVKDWFSKFFPTPEVPTTVDEVMNAMNNSEYPAVDRETVANAMGVDIETVVETVEPITPLVVAAAASPSGDSNGNGLDGDPNGDGSDDEEPEKENEVTTEDQSANIENIDNAIDIDVEKELEEVQNQIAVAVSNALESTEEPAIEEEIEVAVTKTEIPTPKEYEEIDRRRKEKVDPNLVEELMNSTKADKQWVERALESANNDVDLATIWLDDRGKISYDKPNKELEDKDAKIESLENKVKELELVNAAKDDKYDRLFDKMNEILEAVKHLEKTVIASATIQTPKFTDDFEIPFQK